ncbi:MAG: type IV toxin-antitoxin system AbiEi family antitoxin domain-containing protein [Bdellovibrionales bacterium]|nr:type IV toxin-antitoxin system AbiEi family antitoxin domain-containing protein [Bdellovibrionales bacterium]
MQNSHIFQYFKTHAGYARTRDLYKLGVSSRRIKQLVEDGSIQRIRHGLYKLTDYPWHEYSDLVDICKAKPQAIIALASALEFHGLTTFMPSEITIALPKNYTYDSFKENYPPVKVFYFPERFYNTGCELTQLKNGEIRIYSKEKTICDMFRYRKTFGEDIALEGLNNYLSTKDANIQVLQEFAARCDVKTIVTPYIKAMVAR